MTVTAIIAEYNPFHLGHKYHIEQAKKSTNADIVLVIMSGNYVQRGEPAIFDKHLRAKIAVSAGADMVIELPYPYSCSSAEFFAESAVTILNKLGCVDYLCFGSECNDITSLYDIANILVNEPSEYKEVLKKQLKAGLPYPKARHLALMNILNDDKYEDILTSPNNILGIEYIKSIIKLGSRIKPYTIKRIISDYHHSDDNNPYYSASSIRNDYNNEMLDIKQLSAINPLYTTKPLYPVVANDFSNILATKLVENKRKINTIFDISSDLSDRIMNNIDKFISFDDFVQKIKTKNTNYSSISRAMCHIMLGTTQEEINEYRNNGYLDHARVLYFNDNALPLFKTIDEHHSMKLITKLSKAFDVLDNIPEYNKLLFEKNLLADDIYRLVTQNKYNISLPNEYQYNIK